MKLKQVKSPKDLKKLSVPCLEKLAAEIRQFLLQSLSNTGGHLASNLGVVELTLAIHSVFDAPVDKIIWDVGHQCYVHKILTGRGERFDTLRQLDGLSGFPKPDESEYDAFGTGHSSTSISAAFGLAVARDLKLKNQKRERVVAVIGDGSMTGGLAYEALNNAGRTETDLLVVLNDNQMSIAENVGAVSRHLNDIRTAPFYLGAKKDVHEALDLFPLIGKPVAQIIERVKDALKYTLLPGVMFEKLGFRYYGPVDGHDIGALKQTLEKIKNIEGPVMLHVLTVKGKGYRRAENAPVNYHGVEPAVANGVKYSEVFGDALVKLAERDRRIVAVTAAMCDGTGLCDFKRKFPKRFFDVGIAEAHAVTFAAGLAKGGMKPVVSIYSTFLQRAYDQILHDVCLQNLPVVFCVDRAGASGPDGETHQGLYDISFLSHIPNLAVAAPKNEFELREMLAFALGQDGPVAIRYPKCEASSAFAEHNGRIEYGRCETIREGKDAAIVFVGAMAETAGRAAQILNENNVNAGIYNARFVKPLDMGLVTRLLEYKYVFTLEENVRSGGYGVRLLDALNSTRKFSGIFHNFAFPDVFVEHGTRAELLKRYKLDAESVASQMLRTMGM